MAAAKAVNYVGAGTVEFIFDNDTQDFYFMEMLVWAPSTKTVTNLVPIGTPVCKWNIR